MAKRKVSMLLPVYNEEMFLFHALNAPMQFIDQVVVVDGGPFGPSTDRTKEIVDMYDHQYPGIITYLSGTFVLEDGAWDESAQRNLGMAKIDNDILMPHCGDMIYSVPDMRMMVRAINNFPERKIFYCPFIEFWMDTKNIRLYRGFAMEEGFVAPAISDINFLDMSLFNTYKDGPHMALKEFVQTDFMYIPYAFRYHYGWLSGFDVQVRKQFRRMKMGAWQGSEQDVSAQGDGAIVKWAINHVLDYPNMGCAFPYQGYVPCVSPSYIDKKEETITMYEAIHGEGFWYD